VAEEPREEGEEMMKVVKIKAHLFDD